MKSNKCYIFIIGVRLVVAICGLIMNNLCEKAIVYDFMLAIGSGVLCSAVVSWIVECKNNRVIERERAMQRKYILGSVVANIKILLKKEIGCLTECSIICQEKQRVSQKLTHKSVCEKIQDYIENITNAIVSDSLPNTNCAKDQDHQLQQKYYLAHKKTLWLYSDLVRSLSRIIDEINYFMVSGVFSDQDKENIEKMYCDVLCIIEGQDNGSLDNLLGYKQNFYENIYEYLNTLNIDINEEDKYSIWQGKENSNK